MHAQYELIIPMIELIVRFRLRCTPRLAGAFGNIEAREVDREPKFALGFVPAPITRRSANY